MNKIEDLHNASCIPMRNIEIVRGRGTRVWDSRGNEYIDCVAGFGVVILGHCNDFVNNAIIEQSQRLVSNPYIFYNDTRAMLYEKLTGILPKELSRIFLCNSGTESVECALKIARKFTGKKEFIAMKKGFHGRSMGSLSATWNPHHRKNFEPLVPGFNFASFNDIESVRKLVNDNTAAIILELIQGEGGVYPATLEFIKELKKLCDRKNILLIFDEVQTGFGRTGKFFAFEHFDIIPDILCINKGMGNGFPIGATIASSEIFESLDELEHMSTMGGNPLACAASVATIDFILNKNLCEKARMLGNYFIEQLRNLENGSIREVRGMGLMLGLELKFSAMKYILETMKRKVLVYNAGVNTIRILPPLVITKEEIDTVCDVLGEVL